MTLNGYVGAILRPNPFGQQGRLSLEAAMRGRGGSGSAEVRGNARTAAMSAGAAVSGATLARAKGIATMVAWAAGGRAVVARVPATGLTAAAARAARRSRLLEDAREVSSRASRVLAALRSRPLAFAAFCGCLKDAGCDFATQRAITPDQPWDWRRTAIFAVFGTVFVGAWQYALFSVALPRFGPSVSAGFASAPLATKLRDTASLRTVAAFVVLENAVNQPLLYFPTLYSIKHSLEHAGSASLAESAVAGARRARELCYEDNAASIKVWGPVTLINGLCMPLWARVPFMTACGCGWTCWVSFARGAPEASSARRETARLVPRP